MSAADLLASNPQPSTALCAAVADELEADWEQVTVLQGDADSKYGPQGTGGSQSINVMLEPMRKAGAAGREMLVAAGAKTWSLPVADCYAKLHVVYNRVDSRQLPYGDLVDVAHTLPVPDQPVLKQRTEFRYIGKPLPRKDQSEVVTGKRIYGADAKVPGIKYAAIRHVPVFGGTLKSLDKTAALALPGVVGVVEIPRFDKPFGTIGGVAVVADNTWIAEQALQTLKIEWDLGSHLSHSPMEPMASLAWVRDDRCEIWASTQDPKGIQETVGAYLGRKPEDITVHVMMAGGAFGRKYMCDYVQEAAALSKAVSAPVQLTWSREEDTRTGYYHSCSAQHLEASLGASGKITGWLQRAAFPTIGSIFNPSSVQPSADDLEDIAKLPFGVANMRVESGLAEAHTRIGWYRAVYAIFYGFAVNVFIDELAQAAGIDTLQFYRNIYDNNHDPDQAEKVQRSRAALEEAARMAGWGKQLPAGQGLGLAVFHSFESYVAMVVHAEVKDGKVTVHRVDCAVDCGLVLNPELATAQMEGAVIMGMGLALETAIQFKDGAVVNSNFHDYLVTRIDAAPTDIRVKFIGQDFRATGLGEPGVPTMAPALVNAIVAAGGPRYRSLPIQPAS
ncbi:MAG: molybdopterin cofactor-binding domain-containing protein [Lysobacterales bacterium]